MSASGNGTTKRAAKAAKRATAHAEESLDQATDRIRQFADDTISSAESQIHAVQQTAHRCMQEGREAVDSMGGLVRGYVKAQPIKSLAIAVGAGMLLSMILRRR
jgi:ElaB/YqjD/DUF883 family membrane-anchored ribosome-binding protein